MAGFLVVYYTVVRFRFFENQLVYLICTVHQKNYIQRCNLNEKHF